MSFFLFLFLFFLLLVSVSLSRSTADSHMHLPICHLDCLSAAVQCGRVFSGFSSACVLHCRSSIRSKHRPIIGGTASYALTCQTKQHLRAALEIMVIAETSSYDTAVPVPPEQLPGQTQTHTRTQSQPQPQPQPQVITQSQQPTAPPMNPSGSFTFENFHLDPEDFQNFLLINPPLTEYSSHYYLNLSNSGNSGGYGSGNTNSNQVGSNAGGLASGSYGSNVALQDPLTANSASVSATAVNKGLVAPAMSDSDQLINELALKKEIPTSSVAPNEPLLNAQLTPQLNLQPFSSNSSEAIRAVSVSNTSSGTTSTNTRASGTNLQNPAFVMNTQALNGQTITAVQPQQQQPQQPAQIFNNQYPLDVDVRFNEQQLPLPTRRLSISNGQIGQISMMVHSQLHPGSVSNSSGTPNSIDSGPVPNGTSHGHGNSDNNVSAARQPQKQQNARPAQDGPIEVDTNGVPTRELLYNNEVIFNPNGPIPGTNAWKRAKILERNRIAASKCRAKKKNLQKKLQQDVGKLSQENDRLRDMLVEMKRRVERYCERSNVDINEVFASDPQLKKEEEDEEMLRKKIQAQSTSEQVDLFLKENVL